MKTRSPTVRFTLNLGLVLGSILLAILALEFAARLYFPDWRYLWTQSFLSFNPTLGTFTGKPGYEGRLKSLYGEYDIPIRLDNEGFRNARSDNADTCLVTFGDSFGFGWGVKADEYFGAVAAGIMKCSALNFSVPATDISDYARLMRWKKPLLKGRHVVLLVTYENDILAYPTDAGEAPRALPKTNVALKLLVSHSALTSLGMTFAQRSQCLVHLVRQLGILAPSGASASGDKDPVAASLVLLEKIRDEIAPSRLDLVIVPPRPQLGEGKGYMAFLQKLQEAGFEVLAPEAREGDYYPHDGHWTAAAHARVGRLLAQRLSPAN